MIKSVYTYIRIALIIALISFFALKENSIKLPFFIVITLFIVLIPIKKIIKANTLSYFENKFNYFLDEFVVYAAVALLSLYGFAPFETIVIYFYKDATIGAIRNFAIQNNEHIHERYSYKVDKVIQYALILVAAFCFAYSDSFVLNKNLMRNLFYGSAAISAVTLILFFLINKDFMKRIHDV